jgi:hypothetical protein
MAFILVLTLHKSKAYSLDNCQIVLLRMQSKRWPSKAAMQAVHDGWQKFVISIKCFRIHLPVASLF